MPPDRRRGDRHRPTGDALRRPAVHPRGDPVPASAARAGSADARRGGARPLRRGLPFELFLGLRYLRARGQRANLSLFVWIGVGGVFLGVAALIVVLAVMTGFQDGIRDKIIAANPHLLSSRRGRPGLPDAAAVAGRVRGVPGVRTATPFVLQQALFTARRRRRPRRASCAASIWPRPPVRADLRGQLTIRRARPPSRTASRPSCSAWSWRGRSA